MKKNNIEWLIFLLSLTTCTIVVNYMYDCGLIRLSFNHYYILNTFYNTTYYFATVTNQLCKMRTFSSFWSKYQKQRLYVIICLRQVKLRWMERKLKWVQKDFVRKAQSFYFCYLNIEKSSRKGNNVQWESLSTVKYLIVFFYS